MQTRMDIMIAGVGGQGTVLSSRILAQAALDSGLTARTAENIGMAQREGSVQSHVRIGAAEFGPLIGRHQADVLLGFEPAEAQRAADFLKPDGIMIVNMEPVYPVTVALGQCGYAVAEIQNYLSARGMKPVFVNATKMAAAAGNYKTLNAVMLGLLSATGYLPMKTETILATVMALVPEKARDVNRCAFEMGYEALQRQDEFAQH